MISMLHRIIDFIAPRKCTVCGCRLAIDERPLCSRCNVRMPRTGFAETPLDNEMARTFWARIKVERCAALFFYQPHSAVSNMIYNIKYRNRPDMAREMGRMAAGEFMSSGFFEGIDIIVPVPLAKKRLRQRGYNQSEEIACGVADVTGLRVSRNAVERVRNTESQTTKHRSQRNDNMKDAFLLRRADAVKGRHVLIIDDIVTTGSTICACGKELIKAGDVTISILSLGFTKS